MLPVPTRPVHRRHGTWRRVPVDIMRDARLRALAVAATTVLQLSLVAAAVPLLDQPDGHLEAIRPCPGGDCPDSVDRSTRRSSPSGPAAGDAAAAGPGTTAVAADRDASASQPVARPAASEEPADAEADAAGTDADDAPESTAAVGAASEDAGPPAADEVLPPPQEMVTEERPSRRMPYGPFRARGSEMIARLPSLEVLHQHFPDTAMTRDVPEQLDHIEQLDAAAEVTVEGYEAFEVDRSRRDAFVDDASYHERIRPRMFLVHWTGIGYTDVDHFVRSLRPHRVQFFMDREADVYDLFEHDDHKPAHARGANDFSQGVEIETGPFDGSRSPLFSYTPAQIEHTVYLAVEFLRRNGLAVDETTLVGHYAADLIFTNPYYDPRRGTFSRDRVRKFDPPQELMEVIVRKASDLDTALGARDGGEVGPAGAGGVGGPPAHAGDAGRRR